MSFLLFQMTQTHENQIKCIKERNTLELPIK